MALYKFKVSDKSGKVSQLLVEGDSQLDATRRLQRRGVMPLEFLGEGSTRQSRTPLPFQSRFNVVDFTDRLVPLLQADIPLERSLAILREGLEDDYTSQVIGDLRRGLHEGRRLSDLIRDRRRLFPSFYASAVEAGEEAGALPQIMSELRRFLNESRELRSFVLSASIYPGIVLLVSIVVVGVLLGFIVPRFAIIIANTGRDLSGATEFLLNVSTGVRSFWWVVPALVLVAIAGWYHIQRSESRRIAFDRFVLGLPLVGRVALLSNLARLARTMSILMRSGVHLLDTVAISVRILQNNALRQSLAGLEGELRQGERISNALGNSRYVPSFMLRMLAVGEETGSVDTMLERVAERYEQELRRLISRVLSLFEPVVIVVLGLLVGGIVTVMFMAIMDMQAGL